MATIKGIFEPFAEYVQEQLNLRKKIISNSKGNKIISNKRYEAKPELFHAYANEKQSIIRMMSGVDIRTDKANPELFEIDPNRPKDAHVSWDETYLKWKPSGFARQYILEGGTRYYDDKIEHGWRGGFTTGKREDDMVKAFGYGDRNVRANAQDNDFGVVPMPGIIDAQIHTKSDDGALREARVNFVCFNRRQLEILEMLYMRPGYPVALEWGWNPFVSNEEIRETYNYTIKPWFFKENQSFDDLNERIRKYKEESGGNYDGFIGYIKNFTFKAREDGGYDCVTELIAHGEILESLQSPTKKVHKIIADVEEPVVQYEDRLLFYLRALKYQLNSAGSQFYLSQFITNESVSNLPVLRHNLQTIGQGRVPDPPKEYTGESLEEKQQKIEEFQKQYNETLLTLNNNRHSEEMTSEEARKILLDKFPDIPKLLTSTSAASQLSTPPDTINPTTSLPFAVNNQQQTFPSVDNLNLDNENIEFNMDLVLSKLSDEEREAFNLNISTGFQPAVIDRQGGISISTRNTTKTVDGSIDHQIASEEQIQGQVKETNERARAWNEFLRTKATELDLAIPAEYRVGLSDIRALFGYINKETKKNIFEDVVDPIAGKGFEALLGGAILKQTIKYNPYTQTEQAGSIDKGFYGNKGGNWGFTKHDNRYTQNTSYDSGLRRNIYVRWDLICQMINHLANASSDEVTSKLDLIYNYQGNSKKSALIHPLLEFTYMNPNQRTWNNRKPSIGKTPLNKKNKKGQYINNTIEGGSYIEYSPCKNFLADPMLKSNFDGTPIKPKEMKGKYHPIIGNSMDERVCLMPHQVIFDDMFEEGVVRHEARYVKEGKDQIIDRGKDIHGDGHKEEDIVNLRTISSYESSNKPSDMRNSIGFVYFNLNFLLDTYESLRLKGETRKEEDGSSTTYRTLNRDFNMFDYIKALWGGVNDACAGFYNFGIHLEHERPNVARIIDMRISGVPDNIYEFEPQGLKSITRQFYFDSKIDADMASVISIAAQAPNSEQSLESLSFKAFHKNIKSRFLREDYADQFKNTKKRKVIKRQKLADDIREFSEAYSNLIFYLRKMHNHTFESKFRILQPSEAVRQAEKFAELRRSILNRYPLFRLDKNGKETDHPKAGFWREGTTLDSNAIIPLQCSLQLDGMAGIIPLQLFKIHKDKLPLAYQREDIVFVVKSEKHNISSTQDWVVEITGQLALLNDNPNNDGSNNILEYITPPSLLDILNGPEVFPTTWADYLRDIIDQFGHSERDYTGNLDKEGEYKEPFYSGEISSYADITPEMAAFGEVFIKCMEDEDWCNVYLYGDNYNTDNPPYNNNGILTDVKIEFTAGNDKEHQKPDLYCTDGKTYNGDDCPNYSGTKHRDGNAFDFIITSPSIREVKKPVDGDEFAKLININFNYASKGSTIGEAPTSPGDPQEINVGGSLSAEAIETLKDEWLIFDYALNNTKTITPLKYPTNYNRTIWNENGARVLNAIIKLCYQLKKKHPNLWFKDEYRQPGKTATGAHFHLYARSGKILELKKEDNSGLVPHIGGPKLTNSTTNQADPGQTALSLGFM